MYVVESPPIVTNYAQTGGARTLKGPVVFHVPQEWTENRPLRNIARHEPTFRNTLDYLLLAASGTLEPVKDECSCDAVKWGTIACIDDVQRYHL